MTEMLDVAIDRIADLEAQLAEARSKAAEAQARENGLRDAITCIVKAFSETEDAGYRSRDRVFCVDVLTKALEEQQESTYLQSVIDRAIRKERERCAYWTSLHDYEGLAHHHIVSGCNPHHKPKFPADERKCGD